MIELQNVTKTYILDKNSTVEALRGVDMSIERGEFLIITGRSGSGKTTLLNLAAGLTRPSSGKVIWEGVDLWTLKDSAQSLQRGKKIGFIFQFPSLIPSLTSLENVILPHIFVGRSDGDHVLERGKRLLDLVGLSDKLSSYPRQLSAGQQQRVVVARALMNEPELLLADEPTSDLDEQTEQEIMDLFVKIHKETGVTVAMVTHTTQLVKYGTRAVEMASGKIKA